jgi:hypothetical protein
VLAVIEPQASIAHVTTVVGDTVRRAFKEQVGVTNVKRPNIRISYEPVKGRPVVEGTAAASRPVAPPPRDEEQEPVSWPPPPPDVSRNEAEPEPEPAAAWQSNWEPGSTTTQAPEKPAETATEREEQ